MISSQPCLFHLPVAVRGVEALSVVARVSCGDVQVQGASVG
jgi:hypothetical protein